MTDGRASAVGWAAGQSFNPSQVRRCLARLNLYQLTDHAC